MRFSRRGRIRRKLNRRNRSKTRKLSNYRVSRGGIRL